MITVETSCYHCGTTCENNAVRAREKLFCCEGCKLAFELLNENGLRDYYQLNDKPGISQPVKVRPDKFAFLEDNKIQQQLIQFRDEDQTHVTFYIPHHCSSCLWLLEHLYKLDAGIQRITINFSRKEAQVIFRHHQTSLRKVAELLTSIGYEPYISLWDLQHKKPGVNRQLVFQLGIAGFCFGNIMLLSFPEYFSGPGEIDARLFRYLNLILFLPVCFYSAAAFYRSAWSGLKHGFINIDVPIVLAIAVTLIREGKEMPVALPDIEEGLHLLIHDQELIPADGILIKGKAYIDYSFVTGESAPSDCNIGDIVYAGGRQLGGNITLHTIKPVAQSYLTSLWNRQELQQDDHKRPSFIHLLGRHFTWAVLVIAALTATWWAFRDPVKIWPAVTAILIIVCPCALLLASSFTNGHILRILSRHRLCLRNATAIERLAATDHIVFDKTGTLTDRTKMVVIFHGMQLTPEEQALTGTLAAQSTHPLSRAVLTYCGTSDLPVTYFESITGMDICGKVGNHFLRLGNPAFTGAKHTVAITGSTVYLCIDGQIRGYFSIHNGFRDGIPHLLAQLGKQYKLTILSGDNEQDGARLRPPVQRPCRRTDSCCRQFHTLFAIGFFNGLLPCGLVYLGIAGAVASDQVLKGALFMTAFGAGTLPAMITLSWCSHLISLRTRNFMKRCIPVIMTVMALLLIIWGLNLGIPYLSPALHSENPRLSIRCHQP